MSARAFIFLAMVVVVSKTQAGAVLRGVVLSNELGGPPMGNIEVSALVGNTNNTDANGKFTFSFPNKKPGDTVPLTGVDTNGHTAFLQGQAGRAQRLRYIGLEDPTTTEPRRT